MNKTKYNIDHKIWYMKSNRPVIGVITNKMERKGCEIVYGIDDRLSLTADRMFTTKKGLAYQVFGSDIIKR